MQTAQLKITGMDHEGCADEVNGLLVAVDGVSAVNVSLSRQAAEVVFDEHKISPLQLLSKLEGAGYQADGKVCCGACSGKGVCS